MQMHVGEQPVAAAQQQTLEGPDDWEQEFRRAYSLAQTREKDVAAPRQLGVAEVGWPLISDACGDVRRALRMAVDSGIVEESAAASILDRMLSVAYGLVFGAVSRSLVFEIAAAKSTGLLADGTPEEQYDFFVRCLSDPAFSLSILDQYPVLEEQLTTICRHWKEANTEFLHRLCGDWPLITKKFFPASSPGGVADISLAAGDSHRGGRTTCIVLFASGARLVYKPRSFAGDVHFGALADWINDRIGEQRLLVPESLDCGTHGWSEFITSEPVQSEQEISAFYQSFGGVLAASYLVGLSDLHSENLIAHGRWPVLIDLETLFRPQLGFDKTEGAARECGRMMGQSVLSTGLLPAHSAANKAALAPFDLSGVSDLAGQVTPFDIPVWEEEESVDIRLVYQPQSLDGHDNVPVLNGSKIRPASYCEDLVKGFTDVYRVFVEHRAGLGADHGPLAAFRDDVMRVVLRPTLLYAHLLQEGFHPDFLQVFRSKENFFKSGLEDAARNQPVLQFAAAAERRDLWLTDIPYFTTQPGAKHIATSSGELLEGMIEIAGLDAAYRRLEALSGDDLDRQWWLIRTVLARADTPSPAPPVRFVTLRENDEPDEIARSLVAAIAQRICGQALVDQRTGKATWVTISEAGQGTLAAVDADLDLYSGLPGIALFLCSAGRFLGTSSCLAVARGAVQEVLARLAVKDGTPLSHGGFAGRGGLAYAFHRMAPYFPELKLDERAADLLLAHEPFDQDEINIDVIDGLSGMLMACLTLYQDARRRPQLSASGARLLDHGREIGARIMHQLEHHGSAELPPGFAHGRAGVALALSRLYRASGDVRMGDAVQRLVAALAAGEQSPPAPGRHHSTNSNASWCHGDGGRALLFLGVQDIFNSAWELRTALERLASAPFQGSDCLCHGSMGTLVVLQKALLSGATDQEAAFYDLKSRVMRSIARTGLTSGIINGIESPGLMDGLAGIGLGALYLLDPDQTPGVLGLE